jgi:hypothetical protein
MAEARAASPTAVASRFTVASPSAAAAPPPPRTPTVAQPLLVCLFHLNLAFSSLEEEAQAEVVRRCYRPALQLVRETGFPIAIEATGWTLRRIAALDPGWIERARELLAAGRLELVGSAHAQCIAPLLPAEVNAWNLRLGRETYAELLGVSPRVALFCEQAYSPGLVPLYLAADYEAIVVDWDNAYRSHPGWPSEWRLHPQRAVGGGASIPVVWSESIAFQKFQRFAHGELTLDHYLHYVCERAREGDAPGGGALMLYANDAEVFDHRPGRFAAEPELGEGEWERIAAGLRALRERGVGVPALPSDVLDLLSVPVTGRELSLEEPIGGRELSLEAPGQPIPVKKQDKYNVSRWAVTGRDDLGVNTRCWRLYERLRAAGCADPDAWRTLCELWASDYRTHITESRWRALLARLEETERRWPGPDAVVAPRWRALPGSPAGPPRSREGPPGGSSRAASAEAVHTHEGVELCAGPLTVRLNSRRGLAIEAFADARLGARPLLGVLEHGYFPTIELGADFYSGHLVQEPPLAHKVTDLERVRPEVGRDGHGRPCARARIATALGPIEKAVALDSAAGCVELEWTLRWPELPLGSLRLGYVTLLPEAFRAETLWYATHNGGRELERHPIAGAAFDHGAPVSALVSCRQGLGMTEGVVLLGDAERVVRVEVDQARARPLALLSWTPGPERWLLRLCFALTESDETRRGPIRREPDAPQRMRLRISAGRWETPTSM